MQTLPLTIHSWNFICAYQAFRRTNSTHLFYVQADAGGKSHERGRSKHRSRINRRKDFRYPPIYPIVYYEGVGEWTAARNLTDRILLGDLFQAYIPDITYKLVRTREYSNEELLSKEDAISLVMLLNKIQQAEDFQEVIEKVKGGNMGYLFENMEKMDIQLERRNTAEQRQRAEKAEQDKQNLYRILISTYRKHGMVRKEVKKQLLTEIKLEEKEIDNLIETFWED